MFLEKVIRMNGSVHLNKTHKSCVEHACVHGKTVDLLHINCWIYFVLLMEQLLMFIMLLGEVYVVIM